MFLSKVTASPDRDISNLPAPNVFIDLYGNKWVHFSNGVFFTSIVSREYAYYRRSLYSGRWDKLSLCGDWMGDKSFLYDDGGHGSGLNPEFDFTQFKKTLHDLYSEIPDEKLDEIEPFIRGILDDNSRDLASTQFKVKKDLEGLELWQQK